MLAGIDICSLIRQSTRVALRQQFLARFNEARANIRAERESGSNQLKDMMISTLGQDLDQGAQTAEQVRHRLGSGKGFGHLAKPDLSPFQALGRYEKVSR